MARRLTRVEQRLIHYPPTKGTWVCQAKKPSLDGPKVPCTKVNSGAAEVCWVCGTKPPAKRKLLWPEYVSACKKAGIEPTGKMRSRIEDSDVPTTRKRRTARKRAT